MTKKDKELLERATTALQKNLLGENGGRHVQDRFIAKAKTGDMVIPLEELNQAQLHYLKKHLKHGVEQNTIGQGKIEINRVGNLIDGINIANITQLDELIILTRNKVYEEIGLKFNSIFAREVNIRSYIKNNSEKICFTIIKNKKITSALFANARNQTDYVELVFSITDEYLDKDLDILYRAADMWFEDISKFNGKNNDIK